MLRKRRCSTGSGKSGHWQKQETAVLHSNRTGNGWRMDFPSARSVCPWRKKSSCRMCFNVFSHNRDDHSRNFSYLYDEEENRWRLSPAYDLTYSNSIGGEHATCVNGNGLNPGREDLMAVAAQAGIETREAGDILGEVEEKVRDSLHFW